MVALESIWLIFEWNLTSVPEWNYSPPKGFSTKHLGQGGT
ncbi:hypothetical protein CRD_01575 [Raphidiopsis brookii D9]|nr:hypothetical protein CRD_01575 [Raphidiopsis brookii D9]